MKAGLLGSPQFSYTLPMLAQAGSESLWARGFLAIRLVHKKGFGSLLFWRIPWKVYELKFLICLGAYQGNGGKKCRDGHRRGSNLCDIQHGLQLESSCRGDCFGHIEPVLSLEKQNSIIRFFRNLYLCPTVSIHGKWKGLMNLLSWKLFRYCRPGASCSCPN